MLLTVTAHRTMTKSTNLGWPGKIQCARLPRDPRLRYSSITLLLLRRFYCSEARESKFDCTIRFLSFVFHFLPEKCMSLSQ